MFINLFLRISLGRQNNQFCIMKTILKLASDQQALKYQLIVNSILHTIGWEGLKKEDLSPYIEEGNGKYRLFLPYSNALSGAT